MIPARIFDNTNGADESLYLQWLQAHPDGLVVNTRRRPDPAYAVLHRATCHTIRHAIRQTDGAPFTGSAYVKACATTEPDLLVWLHGRQGAGFSKRCTFCAP